MRNLIERLEEVTLIKTVDEKKIKKAVNVVSSSLGDLADAMLRLAKAVKNEGWSRNSYEELEKLWNEERTKLDRAMGRVSRAHNEAAKLVGITKKWPLEM